MSAPLLYLKTIQGTCPRVNGTQKRGDYSREVIISNIAHWKSCPKYCFIIQLNQKMITSNKLNMSFLSISSLSELQSSLIGRHFNLTGTGEDKERDQKQARWVGWG